MIGLSGDMEPIINKLLASPSFIPSTEGHPSTSIDALTARSMSLNSTKSGISSNKESRVDPTICNSG